MTPMTQEEQYNWIIKRVERDGYAVVGLRWLGWNIGKWGHEVYDCHFHHIAFVGEHVHSSEMHNRALAELEGSVDALRNYRIKMTTVLGINTEHYVAVYYRALSPTEILVRQ